jgi:NAD(P)-dependent dehydrogenase (short-subunit alcohol dehydrogenase family)
MSSKERRFDGRVVVVTGAGGGLGREYALLLASRGARVLVNDYGGDTLGNPGPASVAQAVADEITEAGGEAIADGTDVRSSDAGERIVAAAVERWGRIDAVINNAGASLVGRGVVGTSDEQLLGTLDIHVGGTLRVTRAAWPHMLERGYGRIVNTASDSLFGTPAHTYVTAKGAVFGFSKAIASEAVGTGIGVNVVLPMAWTRMTAGMPPGKARDVTERLFPPSQVAPAVAFLAHEDNPYNGEAFHVGANRMARVFMAVVPGYQATTDDPLTELGDHLGEVVASDGWSAPKDMLDAVDIILSHVRH